ncbi:hypothetical protein V8E36_003109 [Tilletia maclaganii]
MTDLGSMGYGLMTAPYTPSDTVDLDLKGSACTALWVLALQPVLPHAPAFAFQPDFWRQRDGADGHSHRLKHHERKMLRGTTSWTARAQRRARSQVRDVSHQQHWQSGITDVCDTCRRPSTSFCPVAHTALSVP